MQIEQNKRPLHHSGVILKGLMRAIGINEKILSAQTGVSVSNIPRLKNHPNSTPTVATLKPIADYFEVSIEQLLGFCSIPKCAVAQPHLAAD